jgi:DNA-binding winged helix-turn-helix (wHTH) protein
MERFFPIVSSARTSFPGREQPNPKRSGPFSAVSCHYEVQAMTPRSFRFGEFELDMKRYQLLRGGFSVKLENLPLQLLMLLVRRKGELVSRQEIEEELWGRDVFVDVTQGINTAVRKLRRVLRDHPEHPRYLQTVVGKGYRFFAADVVECHDATETPDSPANHGHGTVTMEELGQAILGAAGLDGCSSTSDLSSQESPAPRQNTRARLARTNSQSEARADGSDVEDTTWGQS